MQIDLDLDRATKIRVTHFSLPTSRELMAAKKFTPPPVDPVLSDEMLSLLHDRFRHRTGYKPLDKEAARKIWDAVAPNGHDGAAGVIHPRSPDSTLQPVYLQVIDLSEVKGLMTAASGADAVALLDQYKSNFPRTRTLLIAKIYEGRNNDMKVPSYDDTASGRSRSPRREVCMDSRQHFVDVGNWFSFDRRFMAITLHLPDKTLTKGLGWTVSEVAGSEG